VETAVEKVGAKRDDRAALIRDWDQDWYGLNKTNYRPISTRTKEKERKGPDDGESLG